MKNIPFNHPAWIEIDLVQFKKNLAIIREYIGAGTKLCLPVKSNAYGHGLIQTSQAAVEEGIDYLGVSCLQEGVLLRQANIQVPILVLGAIHQEQVPELIAYDLELSIASKFKAAMVAEICQQLNKKVKVHLEIDTGMHRTGVRVESAPAVLDFLRNDGNFILKGVYSHLATADEPQNPFSQIQINKFQQFIDAQGLSNDKEIICHISNSAGITYFPEANLDMVRPGLIAFGYFAGTDLPVCLQAIKPCLSIKAKIAYFKTVSKGAGISYNHTYIAPRDTHLLTIPLGYGDGLRRCLSNKASVILNDKLYPIAGNICMDQFMVDIGDDPGYVGSVVTIVGKDKSAEITIQEMSSLCSTIPYEILCGFNDRLPRIYHAEEAVMYE